VRNNKGGLAYDGQKLNKNTVTFSSEYDKKKAGDIFFVYNIYWKASTQDSDCHTRCFPRHATGRQPHPLAELCLRGM